MNSKALTESLVARAESLCVQTGRKARIIVTDNLINPVYLAAAAGACSFAELFPANLKFTRERFAALKGYRGRPGGAGLQGSGTGSVDTTLNSMRDILGISERDILPFISAAISVKTREADAILGGIDAPTEALIAGCSLVMDYGVPSAVFFTQIKEPSTVGMVQKYHDNIFEITLPDSRTVIVSFPIKEYDINGIVDAACEASGKVIDPVVAFISFSTDSRAFNKNPDTMERASQIYLQQRSANVSFGDIQLDAALDRDILLKKLAGRDPFNGRCANCLVYPDSTSAHSFIDYFEWAYGGCGRAGQSGDIIAVADMAIKPEPSARQLARIITDSISTYKLIAGKKPSVALIGNDPASEKKFDDAVKILPEEISPYLYSRAAVTLKDALPYADLFIYSELGHGNPAYKAWQILNPGFFVTQGFECPVCDLSRGDDDPEKIIATAAYLAIKSFTEYH